VPEAPERRSRKPCPPNHALAAHRVRWFEPIPSACVNRRQTRLPRLCRPSRIMPASQHLQSRTGHSRNAPKVALWLAGLSPPRFQGGFAAEGLLESGTSAYVGNSTRSIKPFGTECQEVFYATLYVTIRNLVSPFGGSEVTDPYGHGCPSARLHLVQDMGASIKPCNQDATKSPATSARLRAYCRADQPLRIEDGSTFTPGPMVEDTAMRWM
jgi:hypothetical protein